MTRRESKFLYFFDCPKRPRLHGNLMISASAAVTCFSFKHNDSYTYISLGMYYIGLLLIRKSIFLARMRQMREDYAELKTELTDEQWENTSEYVSDMMFMTAEGTMEQMQMVLRTTVVFLCSFMLSCLILYSFSGK
jgi:hypothetical protein